jgi:hypothetical protein
MRCILPRLLTFGLLWAGPLGCKSEEAEGADAASTPTEDAGEGGETASEGKDGAKDGEAGGSAEDATAAKANGDDAAAPAGAADAESAAPDAMTPAEDATAGDAAAAETTGEDGAGPVPAAGPDPSDAPVAGAVAGGVMPGGAAAGAVAPSAGGLPGLAAPETADAAGAAGQPLATMGPTVSFGEPVPARWRPFVGRLSGGWKPTKVAPGFDATWANFEKKEAGKAVVLAKGCRLRFEVGASGGSVKAVHGPESCAGCLDGLITAVPRPFTLIEFMGNEALLKAVDAKGEGVVPMRLVLSEDGKTFTVENKPTSYVESCVFTKLE